MAASWMSSHLSQCRRRRRNAISPGVLSGALPLALVAGLAMPSVGGLAAQDAHYWTEQYGTSAHLLGGLVVGSTQDLSTVYYNPGGLALLENPSALFAVDAFQFDWIKVEGERDRGLLLEGTRFDPAGGMVAVALPGRWVRGQRVALSILTRRRFRTTLQGTDFEPAIPEGSTEVGRAASNLVDQDYREYWTGLTWARSLGEGWGVGAGTHAAVRVQRQNEQQNDSRFSNLGDPASVSNRISYDYWHVRLLWKLGVRYETGTWGLGLTTTTPSIGVFGSGRALRDDAHTGDVETLFPGLQQRVAGAAEGDLRPSVSSSWAVAGGGHFMLGARTTVHLSAEWFAPVNEQAVLELPAFASQVPGDTVTTQILHRLESVLNAGVGFEHEIQNDLTLFGSFFTDFSGRPAPDDEIRTEFASWDLYHVTGGVDFDFLGSNFTLGLQYMRGQEALKGDFLPAPIPGSEPADSEEPKVRYNRVKILLGFSLDLLQD
jgi:hypothetical protein